MQLSELTESSPPIQVNTSLGKLAVHKFNVGRLVKASSLLESHQDLTDIELFQYLLPAICSKSGDQDASIQSLPIDECQSLKNSELEEIAKAIATQSKWLTSSSNDQDSWVSFVISHIRERVASIGAVFQSTFPSNSLISSTTRDLFSKSAALSASLGNLTNNNAVRSALKSIETLKGASVTTDAIAALGHDPLKIMRAAQPMSSDTFKFAPPESSSKGVPALIKFPRANEPLEKLLIENQAVSKDIRDIAHTSAKSLELTAEMIASGIKDIDAARISDNRYQRITLGIAIVGLLLSLGVTFYQIYTSEFSSDPSPAEQSKAVVEAISRQETELKKVSDQLEQLRKELPAAVSSPKD